MMGENIPDTLSIKRDKDLELEVLQTLQSVLQINKITR